MKQKRLLFLLALLITAVTGAWAQQVLKVKPITQEMATTWAEDNGSTLLTPDHLPGFCPATEEEAKWWADVPQEGTAILIYHIDDPDDPEASTNVSYVQFEDGQYSQSVSQTECAINSLAEAILNQGVKIFYTWAPTYTVKLADGTKDAANWTIVPAKATDPEFGVAKGKPVTLNYKGRLKVKAVTATHDGWNGDLSNIPASALEADGQTLIVPDGTTLKGTLDVSTTPYKIVIPDDATVTLAGVTIDGENDNHYRWAGINLEGDAIIILADYTENTVEAFYQASPGIHVPSGKTLTIQGGEKGTGKLTARSNGWAAGIGGGYTLSCGHIRIEGGDITATGGTQAAGIGGGNGAVCGDITITGGTVTATGGKYCSGIGSGNFGPCGDITITNGVTRVTATKGEDAPYSIGPGNSGTCGTVAIGGTVYWQNNTAVDAAAATYLAQATIVYPAPAGPKAAKDATAEDLGKVIGADGNIYDDADAATAANTTALAKIFYVGSDNGETAPYNHGLALALGDVSDTKNWCSQDEATCLGTGHQFDSEDGAKGDMTGIANTDALVNHTGHTHDAASAARGYNSGNHPAGTSAWFLPSAGQWDKMATAAGSYANLINNAGLQGGEAAYWSSTEGGANYVWFFDSSYGYLNTYGKDYDFQVRACLAF